MVFQAGYLFKNLKGIRDYEKDLILKYPILNHSITQLKENIITVSLEHNTASRVVSDELKGQLCDTKGRK